MTNTLTFWDIFLRVTGALVAVTFHAATLVALFRAMGDRGPQDDGRLTGNPLAQTQLPVLLAAILARVAWPRPLDVDGGRLRGGRWGVIVPILGALAVTLALAWAAMLLRGPVVATLPPEYTVTVIGWLAAYADLSVRMALVNLVPLPPLTGGYLWIALAPALWTRIAPLRDRIGWGLIVLCILAGLLRWDRLLTPAVTALLPG